MDGFYRVASAMAAAEVVAWNTVRTVRNDPTYFTVANICDNSYLVLGTFGRDNNVANGFIVGDWYFTKTYRRESAVLQDVSNQFPALPKGRYQVFLVTFGDGRVTGFKDVAFTRGPVIDFEHLVETVREMMA